MCIFLCCFIVSWSVEMIQTLSGITFYSVHLVNDGDDDDDDDDGDNMFSILTCTRERCLALAPSFL